jgi:hypothetical protein
MIQSRYSPFCWSLKYTMLGWLNGGRTEPGRTVLGLITSYLQANSCLQSLNCSSFQHKVNTYELGVILDAGALFGHYVGQRLTARDAQDPA